MSRYKVRAEPKCRHARLSTSVSAGDPKTGPHAAVLVCDREACIEDAREWVRAKTHRPVEVAKVGESA